MTKFDHKISQSLLLSLKSSKKIPPIYFENLNALRFIAAFSVFVAHYFAEIKPWSGSFEMGLSKGIFSIAEKGSLGVNFFFVLSGFLITYLIFHEYNHTKRFSLLRFLIRRTLRIWPLYFLVFLLGFGLFPMIMEDYNTFHSPLNYAFFLANFDEIKNGLSDPYNFLTAPWSVAVEEQFYLFWGPLLYLLLPFKKLKFPHLLLIMYAGTFTFRIGFWDEERILYYHTLAVAQDIITGSFLAWLVFTRHRIIKKMNSWPKLVVLLVYIIGILVCLGKNKIFGGPMVVLERFVLSSFFAFVILDQIKGEHSFFKFGKIKTLDYLGRISYGFYMFHLFFLFFLADWLGVRDEDSIFQLTLYFICSLTATIGLSILSFHFFEKPILKLKPK